MDIRTAALVRFIPLVRIAVATLSVALAILLCRALLNFDSVREEDESATHAGETLLALAKLYGVSVEELLRDVTQRYSRNRNTTIGEMMLTAAWIIQP